MSYGAIWTTVGLAKRAAALAGGAAVRITEMAVGDGNGSTPTPAASDTALVNEVGRYDLNALAPIEVSSTQVRAEAQVPDDDGPFTIREIGLYDDDGDLVVVANCPSLEIATAASGAYTGGYLRVEFEAVNPDTALDLIVDPAIVMASREYVDEWADLAQHYAWMTFR